MTTIEPYPPVLIEVGTPQPTHEVVPVVDVVPATTAPSQDIPPTNNEDKKVDEDKNGTTEMTPPEAVSLLSSKVVTKIEWHKALIYGIQHIALCAPGLVVFPFIIAESACAGNRTPMLRVQLIASTYVACGLATLLQATLGLRLPILQGTALSFLPPILTWKAQNKCNYTLNDTVPEEFWMGRLQTLSGSLALACAIFIIVGMSCLMGSLSKLVGPMTIFPVFLMLALSSVETMESKMKLHWISIPAIGLLMVFSTFLGHHDLLLPNCTPPPDCIFTWTKAKVFGTFPYLLGITIMWLLCVGLTLSGLEPKGGMARTDKDVSILYNSTWVSFPLPGQFGSPTVDMGLFIGYLVCCISVVVENLGTYEMAARVCEEHKPPTCAVSRAVVMEGLGSLFAAFLGLGVGVTSYAKNVALVRITGVASRSTIQVAGAGLILMGCFTKAAALFATLPDPLVGSILCMSMSIVSGMALSNLQQIDLNLNRNVSILGISLILGTLVPYYASRNPIRTGDGGLDNVINQLLCIKMLISGVTACALDNLVSGATRAQRGFCGVNTNSRRAPRQRKLDAYALPPLMRRPLRKFKEWLSGRNNRRILQNSFTTESENYASTPAPSIQPT